MGSPEGVMPRRIIRALVSVLFNYTATASVRRTSTAILPSAITFAEIRRSSPPTRMRRLAALHVIQTTLTSMAHARARGSTPLKPLLWLVGEIPERLAAALEKRRVQPEWRGRVDRMPSALPAGLLRSSHFAFGQTRSAAQSIFAVSPNQTLQQLSLRVSVASTSDLGPIAAEPPLPTLRGPAEGPLPGCLTTEGYDRVGWFCDGPLSSESSQKPTSPRLS